MGRSVLPSVLTGRPPARPPSHPPTTQAWMNERMMRTAPKAVAEFIAAFSDGQGQLGDSTWLVWAYEGDYTLADLMQVCLLLRY